MNNLFPYKRVYGLSLDSIIANVFLLPEVALGCPNQQRQFPSPTKDQKTEGGVKMIARIFSFSKKLEQTNNKSITSGFVCQFAKILRVLGFLIISFFNVKAGEGKAINKAAERITSCFKAEKQSGSVPFNVEFEALETKSGVSYGWNFGDDKAAVTTRTASSRFENPGIHIVMLVVQDEVHADTSYMSIEAFPQFNEEGKARVARVKEPLLFLILMLFPIRYKRGRSRIPA